MPPTCGGESSELATKVPVGVGENFVPNPAGSCDESSPIATVSSQLTLCSDPTHGPDDRTAEPQHCASLVVPESEGGISPTLQFQCTIILARQFYSSLPRKDGTAQCRPATLVVPAGLTIDEAFHLHGLDAWSQYIMLDHSGMPVATGAQIQTDTSITLVEPTEQLRELARHGATWLPAIDGKPVGHSLALYLPAVGGALLHLFDQVGSEVNVSTVCGGQSAIFAIIFPCKPTVAQQVVRP